VPERPPDGPLVPDYGGACLTGLVPALLGPGGTGALPDWFPEPARGATAVVLFVVDGLGWNQLQERPGLAPTLAAMAGRPIDAVAPTTTATSLTSIATGLTPGEHGVVGYRVALHGEILNVLRWTTALGDARSRIDPHEFQRHRPFLGEKVPVVGKREFEGSGFTLAHLDGTRIVGYRVPSSISVEVRRLLGEGERFVYAYYDGVDKVAHEYGFGPHYDAEVTAADRLVADVVSAVPAGTAVIVTADHGQVHVGSAIVEPPPEVLRGVRYQSGEGRFRWYHTRPGATADVAATATAALAERAWVVTVNQVLDEGWLGPHVTDASRSRLGDVAVVARAPVSFHDPADTGPVELICRHGSLTADEVLVPLLAARAG
jgi:predicted AlkP superfamily pyrophosphatase or phosphodiesterase